MELETKKHGEVVLVKPLSKNIDATVSTAFKSHMIDLINEGNHFFLLNLSQVSFIDSSGLGAVISLLKIVSVNDGNMALCELQKPVINLFKLTRMDQVVRIFPDEKEGLIQLIKKRTQNVS